MKNQNDIIVSAIAFVVLLIAGLVSFFTKREPVIPAAPAPIDTKMPALPANDVVMADALPGGQAGGAGGGGGGMRGAAGGPSRPGGGGGGGQFGLSGSSAQASGGR